MEPDLLFECRKCGHNLYIDKEEIEKVASLPEYECPECGEEGERNWIVLGEGNFKTAWKK